MKSITAILLLTFLIPLVFSVGVKEEIYSGFSTHPSFFCPMGSIRCEMYETIDGMNRNVAPPLLVKTCKPLENCDYINNIGGSLGFRLLPGDICLASTAFKGYKILNVDYAATTSTTTTTITTTTQPETYQKICVQTFRGWCIKWKKFYDTTPTLSTTTIPDITTSTTVPECLPLKSSCLVDSDCCSGNCETIKICKNPSIHGVCLYSNVLKICS